MPKPKKALRKIPKFESEDQEREFWAKHDSTAYVDWRLANKRDVPYHSLLKMFVADRIEKELHAVRQE